MSTEHWTNSMTWKERAHYQKMTKKKNLVKHPAAWSLNHNGASPILLQLFIRNYRYIFKASTKKTVKFHWYVKTICQKDSILRIIQRQKQGHAPTLPSFMLPNKRCSKKPFFYKKNSTWNHLYLWITEQKAVVITKAELRATRNCNQEQYTILLLTLKLA
jgi:hypothetical protein